MALYYGRKPARHNQWTFRRGLVLARHLAALGKPPDNCLDYVLAVEEALGGYDWGMMGNDQYGDCVEADTGHTLMLRTANVGKFVNPAASDVLGLYSAVTGFNPNNPNTDQGTDETTMCQWMESKGFLGHMSSATGMVDPANYDHIKWCVFLFGSCRLGFNVPQYAEDQFFAGKPWDINPTGNATIVGGHDVPIVDYRDGAYAVVTWGKRQWVTEAFLTQFVEEAHGEVFGDFLRSTGNAPNGLNLPQLETDLQAVVQ